MLTACASRGQFMAPSGDHCYRRSILRHHFRHTGPAQPFLRCPSDDIPFFPDPICFPVPAFAYFQDARHGRDARMPIYYVGAGHGSLSASPAIDANCLATNSLGGGGTGEGRCGCRFLWEKYVGSLHGMVRPPLDLDIGLANRDRMLSTEVVWCRPEA